jgi:hypothetical protein
MSVQPPTIKTLSSKVDPEVKAAFQTMMNWFRGVDKSGGLVTSQALTQAIADIPVAEFDGIAPPQLHNLVATGGFRTISLEWDNPNDAHVSYVEVARHTADVIGNARVIGTTSSFLYSDAPPNASLSVVYYYWVRAVRAVDGQKVVGPWNATAGTAASTANDPAYVMQLISGELDKITPSADVPNLVYAVNRFAVKNVAGGIVKYPFIVDATYGVIMDVALIQDLTAANIKVGTLTGDRFAANTIGASKIKTNELIVGDNIAMGPNASISWSKVTSTPTIPSNTNQLTDGAGLGTTATWNNVTGRPNTTYIDANGVYTGTVTANQVNASGFTAQTANIANAAVDTLRIAGQAVTIPVAASATGYQVVVGVYNPDQYPTIITATVVHSYAGYFTIDRCSTNSSSQTTDTPNINYDANSPWHSLFASYPPSQIVCMQILDAAPLAGWNYYRVTSWNAGNTKATISTLTVKR